MKDRFKERYDLIRIFLDFTIKHAFTDFFLFFTTRLLFGLISSFEGICKMHYLSCANAQTHMHVNTHAHIEKRTHREKLSDAHAHGNCVYIHTWKSSHTHTQKRAHAVTRIVKPLDTFTEERAYTDSKRARIHTHTLT